MRRALLGCLLVLHGLAHMNAGMLAAGGETPDATAALGAIDVRVAAALWAVAMAGSGSLTWRWRRSGSRRSSRRTSSWSAGC